MWKITEKTVTTEDGESLTSYGVTSGECTVDDITPSQQAIMHFLDMLNKYEASPGHIYKLVENLLAEI